ncbi:MAG: FAD-dependent oxidoreductase [Alphaproteobacteria bacterium]
MITNLGDFEAGATIEADLCIIGAGAAGITIARALIGSGVDVVVLEGGDFDYSEASQELYYAEDVGLHDNPEGCRLRYFGGTTNHWEGYCTQLRDMDFQHRAWIAHSGWPITKQDLDPYYELAHGVCEIGPATYDIATYRDEIAGLPDLDAAKLVPNFWQFSPPTRFGEKYRDDLENAKNVRVLLNANLLAFETNEAASHVTHVTLRTLGGKTATLRARHYVLACGGIENARALLLSNQVQQPGLGNGADNVGRFYSQHVEFLDVGEVLASDAIGFMMTYEQQSKWETSVQADIGLSDHAQRQHGLLNCGFTFVVHRELSGYYRLRDLWHELRRGQKPDHLSRDLWLVMKDLDSVAQGLYRLAKGERNHGAIRRIGIEARCEPFPNPDSRITLSDQIDKHGQRIARVDWRLAGPEKRTLRKSFQLLGEEFGRLGLGRIKIPDFLLTEGETITEPFWSGCHHIGTTRMSEDPRRGVVDKHCRVHGVDNLSIAGSSVFSTGGYVTPTLTIVALALRLADRLKTNIT